MIFISMSLIHIFLKIERKCICTNCLVKTIPHLYNYEDIKDRTIILHKKQIKKINNKNYYL